MLYNPKWSTTPSFDGFIAWLREQDPNETYNYFDCDGECVVGRYLGSLGIAWVNMVTMETDFYLSVDRIACKTPHTFGAALTCALTYRASLMTPSLTNLPPIHVCFPLPGFGRVSERYHSTQDPAWKATEVIGYPTTSIRSVYFNELVWC